MNLKQLPLEIENIVKDYVFQLQHTDKQRKLNKEIESFDRDTYAYRYWSYCWEHDGKKCYYWT